MTTSHVTFDDVRSAHERIRSQVHRTPVLTSKFFDKRFSAELFFKCENFQRVGAFKFRGASNTIALLSQRESLRGVVTHSSGNHAQAVALAAKLVGIPAYVVMPRTAPAVKRAAVEGYGAEVFPCEPTLEARETTARAVVERTGATFIHPYNDARIIAGQGTAALELIDEVGELDLVLAPVGGGGLLSGTALATTGLLPRARVIGTEPRGADDAMRSLAEGRIIPSISPDTISDALLTSLGELTYDVISTHVERIITASDDVTIEMMRCVLERMKIVIEPSSAVPIAALAESGLEVAGKRIGIILSGGNVDLASLPW